MMPPENPIEIIEYTEYQKKLVLECDTKFKDINSISDNVLVIGENCYSPVYLLVKTFAFFFYISSQKS